MGCCILCFFFFVFGFFFFFNDTATTEIYTLSLHDALPIYYHFKAPVGGAFMGMEEVENTEPATEEATVLEVVVCELPRYDYDRGREEEIGRAHV